MTADGQGTIAISCYGLAAHEAVPVAMKLEELGFDGIWLGEHVLTPVQFESEHPYPSDLHVVPIVGPDTELVDLMVAFSAMAASTSKIFFGSGVFILPLRHPLLLAQSAVSLQRIAGGRFLLGGAIGWFVEEFEALGVPFKERGPRSDEIAEILAAAWRGGPLSYSGRFYQFEPVIVTHQPVRIPLVLGGSVERSLRRAAQFGDGWRNPSSMPLEKIVEVRTRLHQLLTEYGRDPDTFEFHITMLEPTYESVQRYRDEGFLHLSAPTFAHWRKEPKVELDEKLAVLEKFAVDLRL